MHLDLSHNGIETTGSESLAGVLAQCTVLTHLNLSYNGIEAAGARVLQECRDSVKHGLTSISVVIRLGQ